MANAVVFDTNKLLNNPETISQFEHVIIPIIVLEELDKFKTELNERGFNARAAIRLIRDAKNVSVDVDNKQHENMVAANWSLSNDNAIISSAMRNNVPLVTEDVNMSFKAKFFRRECYCK